MRSVASVALIVVALLFLAVVQTSQGAGPYDQFISGSVVDGDGEPFPAVNVTAEDTTSGERYHVLTDNNGTYNISLPQGFYNVSASFENHTSNITYRAVEVTENITGLNFTMREILGTVTGFVTDGVTPVFDATVHITNDAFNYTASSTNPLGQFEMPDVEPGTYVAYAEKEGYWTEYYDKPVVVERGEIAEVNFTLVEQPSTLTGQVTFGTKGLSGVQVEMTSIGYTTSTTTDANGNYTLTGIPQGTYTVSFSKTEFVQQDFQVSLLPFENKKLDVSIEKEASTGGGFIPGFDLTHSLMIVGLMVALITLVLALFIRIRVEKRPELLDREDFEAEEEKK